MSRTIQEAIENLHKVYPSQRITYDGRHIKSKGKDRIINIDVRNFIMINDSRIKNFVKVSGALKVKSCDDKALKVQQAVCKYLTYVYDEKNEGYTEFWQFPFETLALRYGDCEDGAILMCSAMIMAGIPANRVRVCAGFVKAGDPHAPDGGHAYVTYMRNKDYMLTPLDWCYYPDPHIPIQKKLPLCRNDKYKKMWFSFNHTGSWAKKPQRVR